MNSYSFDEIIERRHTDCLKYDGMADMTGRSDLLPLWVADMDFRTPPFVVRALERVISHGILGYAYAPVSYYESIQSWLERRHGLHVERQAIHYLPGIVPALAHALSALTGRADGVLIQPPVYHPFHQVVQTLGRRLVEAPLRLTDEGRYDMDFEALDRLLPQCRAMILCNPHNPGGFTWPKATLERLAECCAAHGVTVISDEIHADLVLPGHRHQPFAAVSPTARRVSLTFMSPSKAFNMPGVVTAYGLVFDEALRERFFTYLDGNDLAFGHAFAFATTEACYSPEGEQWLSEMLAYVDANIEFTRQYLAAHCPGVTMLRPNASFLIFLDNRGLGFGSQEELVHFYEDEARLYLNDGCMFGAEGRGFMRLNVGTPRATLERALGQLAAAIERRRAKAGC